MPNDLPLAVLPPGVSFQKTRHLFAGTSEISFDVTAKPGSAVLAALAANEEFPPGKVDLESLSVAVSGARPVALGGPRGAVTFSGKASAFQGLTLLETPAQ